MVSRSVASAVLTILVFAEFASMLPPQIAIPLRCRARLPQILGCDSCSLRSSGRFYLQSRTPASVGHHAPTSVEIILDSRSGLKSLRGAPGMVLGTWVCVHQQVTSMDCYVLVHFGSTTISDFLAKWLRCFAGETQCATQLLTLAKSNY